MIFEVALPPLFRTKQPPPTQVHERGVPLRVAGLGEGGPCPDPIYPPLEHPYFLTLRRSPLGGKRSKEGGAHALPRQAPPSPKSVRPLRGVLGGLQVGGRPPLMGYRGRDTPGEAKWNLRRRIQRKSLHFLSGMGGYPPLFVRPGGPLPNFLTPAHAGPEGKRKMSGTPLLRAGGGTPSPSADRDLPVYLMRVSRKKEQETKGTGLASTQLTVSFFLHQVPAGFRQIYISRYAIL